ncbi:MAG: DNA-3-methyladenine glycosylase I, partial [Anaerovoracaceae bacterium]
TRCKWAKTEPNISYHDTEWGVPEHDDKKLFEKLILDGMQAGLSWETILKKRDNFRLAFDNFEINKILKYDEAKVQELMQNKGIIRNRLKIESVKTNAEAFVKIQDEFGSFDKYIWDYVGGKPIINHWEKFEEIPVNTEISDSLSKDLKKRGFKFVGSTIIYAYMQAIGMVNDHTVDCFCYGDVLRP